jgi:DNA-binding transcriptional MerR regulator
MDIEIPDKLYFKIGEVAKMAEVPTHVLRYWESEFSGIRPKRASSRQRLYRRQDVELILKIKVLLHHQGYTIAGARKVLASGQNVGGPATADQATLSSAGVTEKLSKLKQELITLQQMLNTKKEN